jgi:aminoglycoside phosphotransferase (APT) family kinase protein
VAAIVDRDADPGIPTLPVVLDPIALGSLLKARLLPRAEGMRGLQVRILRYHPGKRCVFETAWQSAHGPCSWIAKVYADDRSDVYQTMDAIRRAGFGPDAEFSIPEPVAYLPDLRLLLQENVVGRPATELFLSDDDGDRLRMSGRCGAWLARLHAAAPRSGRAFDLDTYRRSIERWSHRVAGLGGRFADKAVHLLEQVEVAGARLDDIERCAGHGSFTHHQVISAGGRTVTFDWDDHAVADPSHDVARFVVGLRRLALRCLGSIRALDGAVDVFLETYISGRGPEVRRNLPFYAAAICLRLAKKDIGRRADRWSEKALATLDEGLRVLEHGG